MNELKIKNEYSLNSRIRTKNKVSFLVLLSFSNPMIIKKAIIRYKSFKNI